MRLFSARLRLDYSPPTDCRATAGWLSLRLDQHVVTRIPSSNVQ